MDQTIYTGPNTSTRIGKLGNDPVLELQDFDHRPSWKRHGTGTAASLFWMQPDGSVSLTVSETPAGTNRPRTVIVNINAAQLRVLRRFLIDPKTRQDVLTQFTERAQNG